MLAWGATLSAWGAVRLLHVPPSTRLRRVEERAEALRAADDPCASRERSAPRVEVRDFSRGPGVGWLTVRSTGQVQVRASSGPEAPWQTEVELERCVGEGLARRWIEDPRGSDELAAEAVRDLVEAPEDDGASGAERDAGELCLFGWREAGAPGEGGEAAASVTSPGVRWVDVAGRWRCGEGAPMAHGHVDPRGARALLDAVQDAAGDPRPAPVGARSHALVRRCGERAPRAVTFAGDRAAWRAVERWLCR